jgi:hypothetical protein
MSFVSYPPPRPNITLHFTYLHVGVEQLCQDVRRVVADRIAVPLNLLSDVFYVLFTIKVAHTLLVQEGDEATKLDEGQFLQQFRKLILILRILFRNEIIQFRVHYRSLVPPRHYRMAAQSQEAIVVFHCPQLDLGPFLQVGGTSVCMYRYSARSN